MANLKTVVKGQHLTKTNSILSTSRDKATSLNSSMLWLPTATEGNTVFKRTMIRLLLQKATGLGSLLKIEGVVSLL